MSASTAFAAIQNYLLENRIYIKDNPAVSPNLTLDWAGMVAALKSELETLSGIEPGNASLKAKSLKTLMLFPKSEFTVQGISCYLVEMDATGDACLLAADEGELPYADVEKLGSGLSAIPLWWENLIELKNQVLESDPESTIFPMAAGSLEKTSLGVGARFTTLHWPAVAWSMRALGLAVTANQNSIPRELVYDVDAMLEGKLTEVPFPFIGGSVPEGHQGQSVQGMTHASIMTYLKYGFHKNRIPWGFNADHQPIGGRFDAIEKELVEGSLFASYITYDLSPELMQWELIEDEAKLMSAFNDHVDKEVYSAILERLDELKITIDMRNIQRLVTYISPAMEKMQRRDALYTEIREKHFTTDGGRLFYKELSIDELPGQTTVETLAVCLAMAEALGVKFNFVAPNIGFQKNFPYPDNNDLRQKVERLYTVASKFGVSIGFHSGSGKSAENYQVIGKVTHGNLEIKTSGRYTYEMGQALSRSEDPADQKLWQDWYAFTRELALAGAFAENETQKKFAREFVERSFTTAKKSADGIFESPQALRSAMESLEPSPDHMFWFEYNFLYVLAAEGSTQKLGDHGPAGYAQRARFYSIQEDGRLRFAQQVAGYILFLAETTGIVPVDRVSGAREKLKSYSRYAALLEDIGPQA